MAKALNTILLISFFTQVIYSQRESSFNIGDSLHYMIIPERPAHALAGSAFIAQVAGLSIGDREKAIVGEILSGNVPSFSRALRSLKIRQTADTKDYELICFVGCDYMAIGSDQDYLYVPLTPLTAQYLADKLNCTLPTKQIVDKIYSNSEITLSPQPIPPSDKMTTVEVFEQHTDSIKQQFSLLGFDRSAPGIVAGHKKDIIISNRIYDPDLSNERVVIYGWHLSENNPIQPVYNGHIARYVDYSHGVRFISRQAFLNGESIQLDDILRDPVLSVLVSDEGVIGKPYYPESKIFTSGEN